MVAPGLLDPAVTRPAQAGGRRCQAAAPDPRSGARAAPGRLTGHRRVELSAAAGRRPPRRLRDRRRGAPCPHRARRATLREHVSAPVTRVATMVVAVESPSGQLLLLEPEGALAGDRHTAPDRRAARPGRGVPVPAARHRRRPARSPHRLGRAVRPRRPRRPLPDARPTCARRTRSGDTSVLELASASIMATLFYEASTRTDMSFQAAMLRMGGEVIATSGGVQFSSVYKGENLADTVRAVGCYADVIVLRHPEVALLLRGGVPPRPAGARASARAASSSAAATASASIPPRRSSTSSRSSTARRHRRPADHVRRRPRQRAHGPLAGEADRALRGPGLRISTSSRPEALRIPGVDPRRSSPSGRSTSR